MEFHNFFGERCPSILLAGAQAVLALTAEGATVPFMARYRKEKTHGLNETEIRKVIETKEAWDHLLVRKTNIQAEILAQGKLTDDLKDKIATLWDLNLLEDLYLPFKQKKKTKAAKAKDAGLQDLADWIWDCGHGTRTPAEGQTLDLWGLTFITEAAGFGSLEAVVEGATEIIIEKLSENAELRESVRSKYFKEGHLVTAAAKGMKPHSKFETYKKYFEHVSSLLKPENSHRYLAARRGWMEEELKLDLGAKPLLDGEVESFESELLQLFEGFAISTQGSPGEAVLKRAAKLSLKSHVIPSIENEVHKQLKEVADLAAIEVFKSNLRQLLMASPFGPKGVLGVDPGIRSGCKVAFVNETGKFVGNTVVHLESESTQGQAKVLLSAMTEDPELIKAVAVGNGTFGRETENFLRKLFKEKNRSIPVIMVSESGASVYSASEAAIEEFPDLDVTVRGAISIARRFQDPLSELVKVDPKSIGVGQYQHDVSETMLKKNLEAVVESCVNEVGVNLNTASYHLLAYVSGIGPGLARSIIEYRTKKGIFKSRVELKEVPRLSGRAFEQAAGFLRVPESENILDHTGVHPERYEALEAWAHEHNHKITDVVGAGVQVLKKDISLKKVLGEFTFEDVINELTKPGRDPRSEFAPFQFREDVWKLEDLKEGMVCPGIVSNVTAFGAFVDIGVHQDGLVHLSQLADRFVKDAKDVVKPGDRVQVKVLEINVDKKQIALTMRGLSKTGTQDRDSTNRTFDSDHSGARPNPRERDQRGPRPRQNDGIGSALRDGTQRGPRRPRGPENNFSRDVSSSPHTSSPRPVPNSSRPVPTPKTLPKPTAPFNNPFAGLAGLKKDSK